MRGSCGAHDGWRSDCRGPRVRGGMEHERGSSRLAREIVPRRRLYRTSARRTGSMCTGRAALRRTPTARCGARDHRDRGADGSARRRVAIKARGRIMGVERAPSSSSRGARARAVEVWAEVHLRTRLYDASRVIPSEARGHSPAVPPPPVRPTVNRSRGFARRWRIGRAREPSAPIRTDLRRGGADNSSSSTIPIRR